MRKAQQVIPLSQVRELEQKADRSGSQTNSLLSFERANLRRVQITAVLRALLLVGLSSCGFIYLTFAAMAWLRGDAETVKFEGRVSIAHYFISAIALSATVLTWWIWRNTRTVGYGEVLAVIHRGQRTNLWLGKGRHFVPASAGIRCHHCFTIGEVQSSITVALPLPERDKVTVTYFLRWRVTRLWEYVDAGKSHAISNQIYRALQERLKKYFAIPYEGPQTLVEALSSYDEVRALIQETINSLGELGVAFDECRVLDIEAITPELAESEDASRVNRAAHPAALDSTLILQPVR